ncbi:adhesion G-protein coupled receptor G6 isoform X2 [Hemibagrus wyckioides]|uniref:adhesion G-protein coupled receptor G6 isoform X2 n=1 Tax=Hemibagrus wyckioides TaxID=337641 RepID=UPI00266D6E93|nr:adhesion G-protein coupled receptor G6 isoform X2 [Hemibagrus wyckioides]
MKFRSSLMITLMFFLVFLCKIAPADVENKCKDNCSSIFNNKPINCQCSCQNICSSGQDSCRKYGKDVCKVWNIECISKCHDICKGNCKSSPETNCTVQVQTCPAEYSSCTDCLDKCKNCHGSDDLCPSLCSEICSPCVLSADCDRIVLIDGGFTGQIQSTDTNQRCVNSTDNISSCLDNSTGSPPSNMSTCILSFETDEHNVTNEECRFSDSGVWLLNNTINNTLQINITRNKTLRPNKPICFVTGCQTCSQTSDLLTSCPQSNRSSTCENVTCVDPRTFCQNATYDPNCTENDSNYDIITLNGSYTECSKCGNPFQKTDGDVKINFTLPKDPSSNTSYFAEMKKINQMILEQMGNKSSVSVSFDDVEGIFVKQQKEEDFKSIYFMYSRDINFNIIEDKTQLTNFSRTFSIPKEAFEKASNINNETLFASLLRFPDFPKNSGSASCNSWDGRGPTPNWTTDGCNTSHISDQVTCSCQHLTFFAVLMSIPNKMSASDIKNLTYLTSIGCGLSLFFLSIALFMHFLLRKGQATVSVHILINLFMALFLLNLSFLVNESVAKIRSEAACKLMAGLMHYFMLSTFTWFGLQALHLCLQLTLNVVRIQNYVIKLCVTGWVPPALVVTVIFISQKYGMENIVSDTGETVSMCWIADPTVHYVVNIGYYSAIFLFTFLTFVVMLRWLWLLRHQKCPTITSSGKSSRPSDALTIMGLCCILGLSWGFAFFAYGPMQIPAYYIFTVLNSCQGFFLFIYYYKSSRLVGEAETLAEESSSTTVVENPYKKPKMF